MPVTVTMKDTLVVETIDESFADFCNVINNSMAQGRAFIGLDGLDGRKVMLNIPNIQVAHEVDDD